MEVGAMSLSAEEGATLEIICSHSNAQGNVKYFCKDPCEDEDVLIKSKQEHRSKFSIRDNGNTFDVTISDLTPDDSGIYWCGVERIGLDTYNKVYITVKQMQVESQSNGLLLNETSEKTLLYGGLGLGVLLVILFSAAVIYIKHRHQDVSNSMGDDVTYSDPFKHTQKPSEDTTSCYSASQNSKLDPSTSDINTGITHKPTCHTYANVQSEGNCYSPLVFTKNRQDSAQSVTTPESTVYSEVKT